MRGRPPEAPAARSAAVRSVVIRSIADPLKAELFTEHAKDVTIARVSRPVLRAAGALVGPGELTLN